MGKEKEKTDAPGVRVVVMEPMGHINVGSIARVMANFGFSDLVLVSPADIEDVEGRGARIAMGGLGVYNSRRVVATLDEALAGCGLVIGATRRARSDETRIDFREASAIAARRAATSRVALLLGRERDGLSREERGRCHILAEIPSVPGPAGSLNISHAAALILCGIFIAPRDRESRPAADMEALAAEFGNLFKRCGIDGESGKAQIVFRGLVERSGLTEEEAQLLEKSFRFFGSRIRK
ncbi:MAG TPA: TrmH family RNA methyltransferase [Spirochaetota bacterium]|nr:TrmH family RNA methyltransferase [Spirochaetota bacterium]HPC41207.1 TrmH family RNA methyltransferase [Spirochaetota bacterium]HPL17482.1 TrmH family RNA methyltransferase [Spirochaetota bacterium]HQF08181.1 TrmH family RNA methyltransferase [Spirochaetota bacterium]HQH96932.1 TrmH family RNA methyltransferase [Spirochaetota bacterium]